MIAIIDYGAGNLGSVYKAFKYIGADVEVTSEPSALEEADGLVLPGVGAFTHCMNGLASIGMVEAVKKYIASDRPFLGICLGLQMLFEESDEMGISPGLSILPGRVARFDFSSLADSGNQSAATLKIPHIGWNSLAFKPQAALFQGLDQGARVYFVHSYYPVPADERIVSAVTEYGFPFCCAVEHRNVHATQFHPEKSGAVGLHILRNFKQRAA